MEEDEVGPVIAKRRFKQINRKTKVQVVFDEKKRREFLTGFRKRKQERKKRAQEELKQQLKEEKKRIRLESKEQYKKLTKSYQPIPELEEKLAELHEVENTTVSILELDTDLLADNNFIIGRNRVKYEGMEDGDDEDGISQIKTESKKEGTSIKNKVGEEIELKTKKELKREIKKKATKIVKKSTAFKKLHKQEQIKQKKKSFKKKTLQMKKIEKSNKKKYKKTFSSS